jgi:hypothetical protein
MDLAKSSDPYKKDETRNGGFDQSTTYASSGAA